MGHESGPRGGDVSYKRHTPIMEGMPSRNGQRKWSSTHSLEAWDEACLDPRTPRVKTPPGKASNRFKDPYAALCVVISVLRR